MASYRKATTFDPECAMCYWGIAWASGPNINAALTAEGDEIAYRAAEQALALTDGISDREQGYIEAIAVRCEPDPLTEEARAILAARRLEYWGGGGSGLTRIRKTTFEDLTAALERKWKKRPRKSKSAEYALKHLERHFAGHKAIAIDEAAVSKYVSDRLDEGAAPATVNRELSALRQAFLAGKTEKLVARVPDFDNLRPSEADNVRTGFASDAEIEAVINSLPDHLQPVVEVLA